MLLNNEFSHVQKAQNLLWQISRVLKISDEELCDELNVTKPKLAQFKSGAASIPVSSLAQLAVKYNFSLEALKQGSVNIEAIRQRQKGNTSYLSPKYTYCATSRKNLIISSLEYAEKCAGWWIKEDVLDYFQVSNDIYNDPLGKINYIFFEEVLEYLRSRGFTREDIKNIGRHSVQITKESPFGQKIRQSRLVTSLYQMYIEDLIHLVEENNQYRLTKLNSDFCEIESLEREEMCDAFHVHHIGGPNRCLYREGALESATNFIGLPRANATETECVFKGGKVCRYKIDFSFIGANLLNKYTNLNYIN